MTADAPRQELADAVPRRLLRTGHVAKALGLSAESIRAYAREGRIPADGTPGGQYRFDLEEVKSVLYPASPASSSRRQSFTSFDGSGATDHFVADRQKRRQGEPTFTPIDHTAFDSTTPRDADSTAPSPSNGLDAITFARSVVPTSGMTEMVTNALRESILSGRLQPGEWLPEDGLAKQFGVSRTPVREALRLLAGEKLVLKASHQGTVVASIRLEDIEAFYAVRVPVEAVITELAAKHRTPEMIAELNWINAQSHLAFDGEDWDVMSQLNHQFHRVITETAGSVYIELVMRLIRDFDRRLSSAVTPSPERRKEMIFEHEAITQAIAAGDRVGAHEAAKKHITMWQAYHLPSS